MNIHDVIQTLNDLADDGTGRDVDVRIASIGHRSKMEYKISDIVDVELFDDGEEETEGEGQRVIYLVESHGNEYLTSHARKAIEGEL